MSGVTGHYDMAIESKGNPLRLFYTSGSENLAVSLAKCDGGSPNIIAAKGNDQKGILCGRSHLDSTSHYGMRLVVGLTKPVHEGDQGDDHLDVTIISPVYFPISTTPNLNCRAVAVASSGEKAWVFHFKKDLHTVTIPGQDLEKSEKAPLPLETSSLAAWYSPESSSAFAYFQANTGGSSGSREIVEYNNNTGASKPVNGSTNAVNGTSIAVAYAKHIKRVFLYFFDGDTKLFRVESDLKKGADNNKWKEPKHIELRTLKPVKTTQICVVVDLDNRTNRIFYNASGQEGSTDFTHYSDPWESE